MAQPQTTFEIGIYADATLAGLANLIPIPLLDWLVEKFFERRIPWSIARRRDFNLSPEVVQALRPEQEGWAQTCLTLLIGLTFGLIKRLSRKLLYFLTIKEAVDKTSYYWRQAFLIDYMLRQGHLDRPESARIARQAMEQVLRTTPNRALWPIAHYVVTHFRQVLRALVKVRQGKSDQEAEREREAIDQRWRKLRDFFESMAVLYDQCYQDIKTRPAIGPTSSESQASGG